MASNTLTIAQLIDRIPGHMHSIVGKRPPFTLIMGSGCSFPLMPTTSQIVREDLPWWLQCQARQEGGPTPADYANPAKEKEHDAARRSFAVKFWREAITSRLGAGIALDSDGLPTKEHIAEAYKLALSAGCDRGLSSPDQVRRYFAAMVARVGRRLNPAHLYLAALIAQQPRLFGTIFTTNFDPLLQRAMQLVNVPYFVSDRPEAMQHPDDDEVVEALHLVYAHGSIYRYLLLNSPTQIEEYASRNQSLLQEYFRKHAVLIVGYSGWDDAITRALRNVDQFDHNLYWCDRGPTLEASGLSPDAAKVLNKHANAFYVPIESADQLMLDLHLALTGHALPRLFREPIGVVRGQLESCDLTGMTVSSRATPDPSAASREGIASAGPGSDSLDLGEQVKGILSRLLEAERRFKGTSEEAEDARPLQTAQVRERLAVATDLYFSNKDREAIRQFDFIIEHADVLDANEKAWALFRRGVVYGERGEAGDVERAIADYTAVIEMPDAPTEQRAMARYNRGVVYGERGEAGDFEREIADYTAVIEMPDAPTEQRAKARYNRGVAYRQRGVAGDVERAIADYTAVIEMPDAPTEQRAMARVNRGVVYGERGEAGDVEREIADYTAVIEMPDAPTEQRAMARLNRGVVYGERGEAGDVERAIADFTAVIEMPDAPAEQRAEARVNRGVAYRQRGVAGDVERAIADFTAVIEMPDAPAEQRAEARVNRGVAYRQRGVAGDVERAIADYTAVIEMPDAPAEQRAKARLNRGVVYRQRGDAGDVKRAIADYTVVIEMPDAPAEQRAKARYNRGVAYRQRGVAGDVERAIADYTAVIEMPDAPTEQRADAQRALDRLKPRKKNKKQ